MKPSKKPHKRPQKAPDTVISKNGYTSVINSKNEPAKPYFAVTMVQINRARPHRTPTAKPAESAWSLNFILIGLKNK